MNILQMIEVTMRDDINFRFRVTPRNEQFILDLLILIGDVSVGFTATKQESEDYTTISYSSMESLWDRINGKTKVLAMSTYLYNAIQSEKDVQTKTMYQQALDSLTLMFRNAVPYSNSIAGYSR